MSTAPQIRTSETATSATTIARRTPSRDDDPRVARFNACDSRPDDICSDGSRPTSERDADGGERGETKHARIERDRRRGRQRGRQQRDGAA